MVGNPPQTFGRYSIQGLIADGRTGPVYRAEDPGTRVRVAIKALRTNLPANVTRQIVDELNRVVDWLPSHPAIVSLRAAALKDLEPHILSELAPGEPLDQALKRFGPGAIADLLPRLHLIAEGLDLAAKEGIYHGALHPKDVMVSVDSTVITGMGIPAILAKAGLGIPIRPPYTAPEVAKGTAPSSASDQFSLAAIAFEWLFGQAIAGPVRKRMKVPALPDVNGDALAAAFTTALAWSPSARFGSCLSFVEALSIAVYGTVEPAVVEPVIRMQAVSEPIANVEAAPEPVARLQIDLVTSMQVGPESVTSIQIEAEPVASIQVEPEPVASTHADPEPIATVQAESEPIASAQIEAVAVEVEAITDAHVEPVTTAPVEPISSAEFEPETASWVEPFTIAGVESGPLLTHNKEGRPEFRVIAEDSPNADLEPIDWQGLAARSPFMETLFESVPDTSIPSATPRMIARSPLVATLFESIPDTPIPSATPLVIAPPARAETPIELVAGTSIPSPTPLVIAPSTTLERPVGAIAQKPVRSVRLRLVAPTTQEVSNAVIFALSTDGGRGFALALATTLLLGIAAGFGGGYAAATRRPSPPVNQIARAPVPASRTADTWMPEPVKPAQNVKTAAMVPVPAGAVPTSKNAAIAADSKPADPKTVDAKKKTVDTKKAAPPPKAPLQARVAAVPARPTVAAPAAPAGNGSLVIESQPPGATVTVNGMARGKTPITIGALPAGNYTLTMALPKYEPVSMTVHVIAGERARAAPTLTSLDPERR